MSVAPCPSNRASSQDVSVSGGSRRSRTKRQRGGLQAPPPETTVKHMPGPLQERESPTPQRSAMADLKFKAYAASLEKVIEDWPSCNSSNMCCTYHSKAYIASSILRDMAAAPCPSSSASSQDVSVSGGSRQS